MEHPFLSRKSELNRVSEALSLLADTITITSLNKADQSKMLVRREAEITNESCRTCLLRRAPRLGLMVEDISKLTQKAVPADAAKEWEAFLRGGAAPTTLLTHLETLRGTLSKQRDDAHATEADDGSSSYSDYSDSRTVSSDDEDTRGRKSDSEEESESDSEESE